MATESDSWTWKDVVALLREKPIDTVVQLPASAIEEPASVGLNSLPTGADGRPAFAGVLDDQLGIIIHVAGENYEARLCQLPQTASASPPASRQSPRQATNQTPAASVTAASPRSTQPTTTSLPVRVVSRAELVEEPDRTQHSVASFIAERPGEMFLIATLIGTGIGAAFGGARGALAGALAGGGAGLASVALSTAVASPLTAQMSANLFLALAANALGGRGNGPVLRLAPVRQQALPPHLEEDKPPRPRRASRKR